MSMIDEGRTTAKTPEKLQEIAENMAIHLPKKRPYVLLLSGELGAGKTTFMQGFVRGIMKTETSQHYHDAVPSLVSPTYALLQQYDHCGLTHIDLYRLSVKEADTFMEEVLEEYRDGIIAIEWPERLSKLPQYDAHVHLSDNASNGRIISVEYNDIPIPTMEQIEQYRKEVHLPENVKDHCNQVANVAKTVIEHCEYNGILVRKNATIVAALLHDLLRFTDFSSQGNTLECYRSTQEEQAVWSTFRTAYPPPHEKSIQHFLEDRGYHAIGMICGQHRGDHYQSSEYPMSKEAMILAYSDKRVQGKTIVTVDERFDELTKRYRNGVENDASIAWRKAIKTIEKDLSIPHNLLSPTL